MKLINNHSLKNLAIMRLSALGDVTLLIPMVRTLQHALPELKITWITSRASYQLLEGLSGVEFIVIDKPKSLSDYWTLRTLFKNYSFDVLLALQANLRVNLLYPFINAPIKIGFDSQRARDLHGLFVNHRIPFKKQHLLDSFFSFIEQLGITEKIITWELPISSEEFSFAEKSLQDIKGPLLAVNPMASKAERTWRVEHYVNVLREAQKRWGCGIVFTGGPASTEIELSHFISNQLEGEQINLVGKTSPKQLAAVLSKVKCLLAPDTGPAHIATAVGTKVIGLYAVAPPELSAPYLSRDLVVNGYPLAVKEILKKDPATVKWGTRVHDSRAMDYVTVDQVLDKLETVFSISSGGPI